MPAVHEGIELTGHVSRHLGIVFNNGKADRRHRMKGPANNYFNLGKGRSPIVEMLHNFAKGAAQLGGDRIQLFRLR